MTRAHFHGIKLGNASARLPRNFLEQTRSITRLGEENAHMGTADGIDQRSELLGRRVFLRKFRNAADADQAVTGSKIGTRFLLDKGMSVARNSASSASNSAV